MKPILEIKSVAAPWHLKGNGYILLYKFKKDFLEQSGFIPDFLKDKLRYGFGAVMLVDYLESDVGPYSELLFIPGIFKYKGKLYFHISKIYVNTFVSIANGRKNWGIPKEFAEFSFGSDLNSTSSISVIIESKTIFSAEFKSGKFTFPLNTNIMPFRFLQPWNDKLYITNPKAKSKAHFCKVKNLHIESSYFPDLSKLQPYISLHVEDFKMIFPEAVFIL